MVDWVIKLTVYLSNYHQFICMLWLTCLFKVGVKVDVVDIVVPWSLVTAADGALLRPIWVQ